MFNKIIYLSFFFLFITVIYGAGDILSKKEVLKFEPNRKSYYDSISNFYCKDDVCVNVKEYDTNGTIEIPNKDGKNKTYITGICSPSSAAFNQCSTVDCNSDADCLSNKCINKNCISNDDNPIVHCQDIHKYNIITFRGKYVMNCGKPDGDKCKRSGECSSNICNNKICQKQSNETFVGFVSIIFYIFIIIVISVILCCTGCCCNKCG